MAKKILFIVVLLIMLVMVPAVLADEPILEVNPTGDSIVDQSNEVSEPNQVENTTVHEGNLLVEENTGGEVDIQEDNTVVVIVNPIPVPIETPNPGPYPNPLPITPPSPIPYPYPVPIELPDGVVIIIIARFCPGNRCDALPSQSQACERARPNNPHCWLN